MTETKHTPADYWGTDRCQCEDCVGARVDRDAAGAFLRGAAEAMRMIVSGMSKP